MSHRKHQPPLDMTVRANREVVPIPSGRACIWLEVDGVRYCGFQDLVSAHDAIGELRAHWPLARGRHLRVVDMRPS